MGIVEEGATSQCCATCYHYINAISYDELICELSGKTKKRPRNYTPCKMHGYYDPIGHMKVDVYGNPWKKGN